MYKAVFNFRIFLAFASFSLATEHSTPGVQRWVRTLKAVIWQREEIPGEPWKIWIHGLFLFSCFWFGKCAQKDVGERWFLYSKPSISDLCKDKCWSSWQELFVKPEGKVEGEPCHWLHLIGTKYLGHLKGRSQSSVTQPVDINTFLLRQRECLLLALQLKWLLLLKFFPEPEIHNCLCYAFGMSNVPKPCA